MENYGLQKLGLKPTTLADGLMNEVVQVAKKFADRCDRSKIMPSSFWTKDIEKRCRKQTNTIPGT